MYKRVLLMSMGNRRVPRRDGYEELIRMGYRQSDTWYKKSKGKTRVSLLRAMTGRIILRQFSRRVQQEIGKVHVQKVSV